MRSVSQAEQLAKTEIINHLRRWYDEDDVVELRALHVTDRNGKWPGIWSGYYDGQHFDELAEDAARLMPQATGVYITANPVKPALLARASNRCRKVGKGEPTTSDADIPRLRRLLIDTDPERPAGISASDDELDAALERARAIRHTLAGRGWPEPEFAQSGNGGHLNYRIDLPTEDAHLVADILQVLNMYFSDDAVKVDTTVANPARIWKLYGTLARKGDHTAYRPHRYAKVLESPDTLEAVPRQLLEELAAELPKPPVQERHANQHNGQRLDVEDWLIEHGISYRTKPWKSQQGDATCYILDVCPWDASHTDSSAWVAQWDNGAIAAGCHHNGCQGKDWRELRTLYEHYPIGRQGKYAEKGDHAPNYLALSIGKAEEYLQDADVITTDTCPPLLDSVQLSPELGRDACPWLDEAVAFSRKWSPRSYDGFHEAVAVWLLSTIAAGRVILSMGKTFHTSLYIALVARTTLYAKSTAVEIATQILYETGLEFLLAPDEITPQRYISSLAPSVPENWRSLNEQQQQGLRKRLGFSAQRGWFYDEFGDQLKAIKNQNSYMSKFAQILKQLDDGKKLISSETQARGREEARNPYLALLANITPANIKQVASRSAEWWGDGFFARIAFVCPPINTEPSFTRFPNDERVLPDTLTSPLKQWHQRLGIPEVEITEVGGNGSKGGTTHRISVEDLPQRRCTLGDGVYDAFYNYGDALLRMTHKRKDDDLDGNYGRQAEKALRIAMLLASLSNDGRIEIRHWARAQSIAEYWRLGLHNLIAQVNTPTKSERERQEERVIGALNRHGALTLSRLRDYTGMSIMDIQSIMQDLKVAGIAEQISTTRKGTAVYDLISDDDEPQKKDITDNRKP